MAKTITYPMNVLVYQVKIGKLEPEMVIVSADKKSGLLEHIGIPSEPDQKIEITPLGTAQITRGTLETLMKEIEKI